MIEEEALGFQRNFWGSRPILQRIFETREFDDFQGRELSYAIDCLDAQWIRAMLSRGSFVVVAPSVLAASLAFVAIGLWLVPSALPGLDRRAAWLVLMLYLSNFALVSTTGLLYRATKPLVAPLLLFLSLLLLREQRTPHLRRATRFALVFATSLVMSLLDRQGLFYVLVLCGALAAAWLWGCLPPSAAANRVRRGTTPLADVLATAAALVLCWVYNAWTGPWAIHSLNGYWPDRSFQQLRPGWLLDPSPWREAVRLLGDWTSVLAGSLPPALIAASAVVAAAGAVWLGRSRPRRAAWIAALALGAVLAQTVMVVVMVARYPTIGWIDHRFWYYPLPYQALLVATLLFALERAAIRPGGTVSRIVTVTLSALVLGNVAAWPERRELMKSGPWFGGVERRSAELVRSLERGRQQPLLDGEYRRFYFECLARFPQLAVRTGPYVAEGNGVGLAELRGGRLLATARREAHLPVTVRAAGAHRLAGAVVLASDETLELRLGPQLLGAWEGLPSPDPPGQRTVRFRLETPLAAGASDLVLVARHARAGTAGGGRRFTVLLPLLVWNDVKTREIF